jgi:7-cyano-7-deazaguanine synthase
MQKKAFVLLSGGLDSTTCLYKAMRDFFPSDLIGEGHIDFNEWAGDRKDGREDAPECDWVEAVSIYYGQRHKRELTFAAKTCATFGIKHTILDVGDLLKGKNILLSEDSIGTMEMVHKDYSELKGVSPSYVPFRNGLLLSAITAHAQKYVNVQIEQRVLDFDTGMAVDAKGWSTNEAKDLVTIYYGAHAEDAANWAYPDCTPEFNGSMANAIYTGSYNTIRLATPLQWLEKWQIVQLGESLGVNWQDTWSCYDNGEIHCGKCPTCLARKEAFRKAGVVDPTEYAA